MANAVTITYSNASLGTPSSSQDVISGLISYQNTLPSGFATYGTIVPMLSIYDAVNAGITNTHIGSVASTGSTTVTATGSTGAVISIQVKSSFYNSVTPLLLGTYTVISTDTLTTIATALVTNINAITYQTGFSAASSGATITVTAPLSYGAGVITFDNIVTGSANLSNLYTSFAGGQYSVIDELYYQINNYFIANPNGQLYTLVMSGTGASTNYAEVTNIQNFAGGNIRQVAVFETRVNYSTTNVNLLQTQATSLSNLNVPLEVFYAPNWTNYTSSQLSSLLDLTTLNAQNVSVISGMDALNLGGALFFANNNTYTIPQLGLFLGNVSSVPVEQSVSWVGQNNMDINGENDTLAFGNGTLLSNLPAATINALSNRGYVFLEKIPNVQGSYWTNPSTCVSVTSAYSSVNNNRVIHKASRGLYANLVNLLASPLYTNADGTVTLNTILNFENSANEFLAIMLSNGEISNYSTTINAKQNVVANKSITLSCAIQPVGVANQININLGFAVTI